VDTNGGIGRVNHGTEGIDGRPADGTGLNGGNEGLSFAGLGITDGEAARRDASAPEKLARGLKERATGTWPSTLGSGSSGSAAAGLWLDKDTPSNGVAWLAFGKAHRDVGLHLY
jgi:hypothetical protein